MLSHWEPGDYFSIISAAYPFDALALPQRFISWDSIIKTLKGNKKDNVILS